MSVVLTVRTLAAAPLSATVAPGRNPVPVTRISARPTVDPVVGDTEVTVNATGAIGAGWMGAVDGMGDGATPFPPQPARQRIATLATAFRSK
jgi:hypothetical protein